MIPKDPSVNTAIAAILEKVLNSALHYDPATQNKLIKLAGQVIHIRCQNPEVAFFITTSENKLQLKAHHDSNIDATIKGEFIDFLRLGKSTETFAESSIHVSGKSSLLNELQGIFSQLDIDWEEAIIDIAGVVPGHFIAETLRRGATALKSTKQTFEQQCADFLSEELRVIPSKTELDNYYQAVAELVSDIERVEARVKQLTHSTNNI